MGHGNGMGEPYKIDTRLQNEHAQKEKALQEAALEQMHAEEMAKIIGVQHHRQSRHNRLVEQQTQREKVEDSLGLSVPRSSPPPVPFHVPTMPNSTRTAITSADAPSTGVDFTAEGQESQQMEYEVSLRG